MKIDLSSSRSKHSRVNCRTGYRSWASSTSASRARSPRPRPGRA